MTEDVTLPPIHTEDQRARDGADDVTFAETTPAHYEVWCITHAAFAQFVRDVVQRSTRGSREKTRDDALKKIIVTRRIFHADKVDFVDEEMPAIEAFTEIAHRYEEELEHGWSEGDACDQERTDSSLTSDLEKRTVTRTANATRDLARVLGEQAASRVQNETQTLPPDEHPFEIKELPHFRVVTKKGEPVDAITHLMMNGDKIAPLVRDLLEAVRSERSAEPINADDAAPTAEAPESRGMLRDAGAHVQRRRRSRRHET